MNDNEYVTVLFLVSRFVFSFLSQINPFRQIKEKYPSPLDKSREKRGRNCTRYLIFMPVKVVSASSP